MKLTYIEHYYVPPSVLLIICGARKSFQYDETSLWVSPRVGVKENQIDERPTKKKNVFDKKIEKEKAFTPHVIYMQLTQIQNM